MLKKWRYFGWDKEKVLACGNDIYAHNRGALGVVSLAASVLIVLLSFYPTVSEREIYYLFAVIVFIPFCCLRIFEERFRKKSVLIFIGILLFTIGVFSFTVFVSFIKPNAYVMRFPIFFLCFEVAFIFRPIACLVGNIVLLSAFTLSSTYFSAKTGVPTPNIINVCGAAVLTVTLNWYISYVFVKCFVFASSLVEERNLYLEESVHDQLTGLNNRRSFDQSVDFFVSVCRHVHQTVCVVMMDVDFFKKYNDFYGHQKGDEVLKSVGSVLKRLIEENRVFAARVGGEEFIVMWTENRIVEAQRVVLKLRQMIIDLQIPHEKSEAAPFVTASFGLYVMRGGSEDNPEELYKSADSALYEAKAQGRNCVVILDSASRSFHKLDMEHPDELPAR